MSSYAGSPNRYKRVIEDGKSIARIDMAYLREEVLALLNAHGPHSRTHIVRALHAHNKHICPLIESMLDEGSVMTIERGYHKGLPITLIALRDDHRARGEMTGCFRAAEILESFQTVARKRYAHPLSAALTC